jgi:AAA lid domain
MREFECSDGVNDRLALFDTPQQAWRGSLRFARLINPMERYQLSETASEALAEYVPLRRAQPLLANARSLRNALDRARLRQANRLFAERDQELTLEAITTIEAEDIRQSRVFQRASNGA